MYLSSLHVCGLTFIDIHARIDIHFGYLWTELSCNLLDFYFREYALLPVLNARGGGGGEGGYSPILAT